jgi:high affinity Mn2+ porin
MTLPSIQSNRHFRTLGLASAMALGLGLGLGLSTDVSAQDEEDGDHLIPHHVGKISIDGGLTWVLQATDGAPQNTTDLSYSMDLSLEAPVSKHGKAVIALEAGDGLGVDATLGSLSTANYDAFYTNLTNTTPGTTNVVVPSVSQAYYEGDYMEGRMTASVGKLDVYGNFDENAYANDETDQFLSAIFVRSAGTSYAELDQYYAPGIALKYSASEAIDLTLIAANGNGDGFNNVFDYMYLVGQIDFKPRLAGRDGNYRFYVISDARHNAYSEINTGKYTTNTAWGLSFDQSIQDEVGLFARYSSQDDGIAENIVKSSWSFGALFEGALWGRDRDTIGIGYGSVILNDKANPATVLGFSSIGDEGHIETFYKVGFSDHFTLTGDVQVITNNGGNGAADTVTVAGVRGQLNF